MHNDSNLKFSLKPQVPPSFMNDRRPSFRIKRNIEFESSETNLKYEKEGAYATPSNYKHSERKEMPSISTQNPVIGLSNSRISKDQRTVKKNFGDMNGPGISYSIKREAFNISKQNKTQGTKFLSSSKPTIRTFRKDLINTSNIIKDFEAVWEEAKRMIDRTCKSMDYMKTGKVRVNLSNIGKENKQNMLSHFRFEKKQRKVNTAKEKLGRNKKAIQYEARAIKKNNEAELNNFKKDLKLLIEDKFEFPLDRPKMESTLIKRTENFVQPAISSRQ